MLGLSFSSDGGTLATVCNDRMLRLYTLDSDAAAHTNYRFKKLSRDPVDVAIDGASDRVLVLSLGERLAWQALSPAAARTCTHADMC